MKNDRTYDALLKTAHDAGMVAGNAATPTPMIVGTPTTPFGSDIDASLPTYLVDGGPCGFAWVQVTGNTSFGYWVRRTEMPSGKKFRRSQYHGGYRMSVQEFGQSMERKVAYVRAFVKVLREAGIDAFCDSRMD